MSQVPMSAVLPAAAATAAPRGLPPWLRRTGVVLRSFALFLLAWAALAQWNGNPIQLPSPLSVSRAMVELAREGEVLEHASVSAGRVGIALVLAVLLAVPLGFLMGLNRRVEAYVDPLVELLRPISGIAWIPLALFILGVGNALPVFIMVYVAFFPLLLNTVAGVRSVDRKLLDAARTMGISRSATLRHVIVPAALPTVMVGLRLAFAGAWAAVVAAELIGAPSGLGFAIEWYRQLLMSPKVFGFIVLIGVVGFFCDLLLRTLQRKLTPWTEGTGL
jgi:ABC-type nitrate/sulfonate/bicarbonate transport system permease component